MLHCILTHHILFIHSSAHEHLGCFPLRAVVNNAEENMDIQVCIRVPVFTFLGYICIQKWDFWIIYMVILYLNPMFNFLNYHTIFLLVF